MAYYTVDVKDGGGFDMTGKVGFRSWPNTIGGFDKACDYADSLAELHGVTAVVMLESDEDNAEFAEEVYASYSEPERRTTVRCEPGPDLIGACTKEDGDVGL